MNKLIISSAVITAIIILSACSKNSVTSEPTVMEMIQTKVDAPVLLRPLKGTEGRDVKREKMEGITPSSKAVSTVIKLRKSSLLDKTFLYSASLQFSSIVDGDISTAMMGLSLGVLPAEFKIIDKKLRLVTDARISFESDVNHPSRLILEFPILSQDANSLTIKADKASPILATTLFGNSATASRASFIRSLEYIKHDDLFLIESTIEQPDGSVAEIMESITPRDRIVPADFKPIINDPEINPLAKRFGFLGAGDVFLDIPDIGRVKTSVAQRFNISANKIVHWYVTPNIPEEYMLDVKNGVEGWNRYSQKMWGRDIVKFAGRLPKGIKVGDPRYNLIVWDKVQDAGAAYESQNADPITGLQTHSMIYLPLAWVNIGKEYWNNANFSEEDQEEKISKISTFLKTKKFAGRALPVHCMDSAHLHVNLQAKESPEEFARSLLKGVLFHEMGHALGYSHNFKGSLNFDPDNKEVNFSSSIMDYNNYNEEAGAFYKVDSSDGPLLEYDRQMLSVLYNEAKDVKDSDPVVPMCKDEDADSTQNGIDPLCTRYDIGKDPTLTALRALDLLQNPKAKFGRMTSISAALPRVLKDLPEAKSVDDLSDAISAIGKVMISTKGITQFYASGFYSGSQQALKSLRVFREESLPEGMGYVETDMRERAVKLLAELQALEAYPQATKIALANLRAELEKWALGTEAFSKLGENDRGKLMDKLLAKIDANFAAFEKAQLAKTRIRVTGSLGYIATAPMSFQKIGAQLVDIESVVLNFLETLASKKERSAAERAAGIKSLVTYKKTSAGALALSKLARQLQEEISASTDAVHREELRALLQALDK